MMKNIMLAITFMALPYYIVRTKILLKKDDDEQSYKESKKWGRDFLGVRGRTTKAVGAENYEGLNQCIFVSNHQSHNDIFILLDVIERPVRFIAKKELFVSKIFRRFMTLSKSYPLDREDPRESMKVLKQVVTDLNETDCNVVVFPEGTRSRGSEMLEFKTGLFSMLSRTDVPIIPTYIHESFIYEHQSYTVSFGEPIQPKGVKGQELSDKVKQSIQNLQNSMN